MSLSDIRSRDAVLAAIQEFDHIGREAFLEKYGYGPARTYFIYHNGRLYDSKAILGVAHGYEYPILGPLRWDDFSQGEKTVRRKLARLEFEVIASTGGYTKDISSFTKPLTLYEAYSREEVHRIFSPNTSFTPQSGTWGLHGIVAIPNRPGDFVFFVTFGQQQGSHIFDEGITQDGILSWQSQPRQSLADPQIQQFINHDDLRNSIYLFLRTRRNAKYTYLGRLKYVSHDTERQHPVYFQWQLLDWQIPDEVIGRMGLILQSSSRIASSSSTLIPNNLEETPPPSSSRRSGVVTGTFRTRKVADYSVSEARNRELGLAGELLVIEYEKQLLVANKRTDLADKVRHVSVVEGDGAGYDIVSFTLSGEIKYIEVKTTRGVAETAFYMTSNEVEFARQHQDNYYLYRVYEYDHSCNSGKLFVIQRPINEALSLTPTQYRATLLT